MGEDEHRRVERRVGPPREAGFDVVATARTQISSCARSAASTRTSRSPTSGRRRGSATRVSSPLPRFGAFILTSVCSSCPSTSTRPTPGDCSRTTRRRRLPAEGAGLRHRRAGRRDQAHRRRRVRHRPDDRLAPDEPGARTRPSPALSATGTGDAPALSDAAHGRPVVRSPAAASTASPRPRAPVRPGTTTENIAAKTASAMAGARQLWKRRWRRSRNGTAATKPIAAKSAVPAAPARSAAPASGPMWCSTCRRRPMKPPLAPTRRPQSAGLLGGECLEEGGERAEDSQGDEHRGGDEDRAQHTALTAPERMQASPRDEVGDDREDGLPR
jgi:hypothetical protein